MDSSDLEALNYDIFIVLVTYLDISDVVALSQCSRLLRQFAISHQTWVRLGRRLILQGIPLPTKGFRTPDDLSTRELIDSVLKADRIYRGWTSRTARATKMIVISKGSSQFAQSSRASTMILPITSDIAAMVLGQTDMTIWNIVQGIKLAELSDCIERVSLLPSVFSHEVDLSNKAFYFLAHTSAILGEGRDYRIKVIKVDFMHLPSNLLEIESTVSFEEVASFREFSICRRFGYQLRLGGGFILNAQERRVCQVYIEKCILLFVVLDWDKREAAFIDTGCPRLVTLTRGSKEISFHQVYVCTWDSQNETLVLTIDTGRSTTYYFYRASQLLPFMRSFDEYSGDDFGISTIPVLPPSRNYNVPYQTHIPRNKLAPLAVQQTGFPTAWHRFSGVSAAPFSRPFLAHLKSFAELTTEEREMPAPLRGNQFIRPPSDKDIASSIIPFSLATDGPRYHLGPRAKMFSVRYGALAWTKEEESENSGLTRSLRITRFFCPSCKSDQIEQEIVQVCTPLLPNGGPVQMDNTGVDGLLSLSLDEVHGRLFLIYQTGKIAALHFG
ncbi:uncharacterized protein FOMMEDRAFT_139370 [Fomitiporia mediterranea MF3/22]|uniref:uncharacterized protein n=1 Tax=Fomitiporia mediterranea (strain MF3/22) TaxID=694068 RepID=UPI0004408CC3|nr:uncharacterized protein FOMMEDRAFT_139370 [Fomitiporia mediterranea MF3/22]EJD06105.1 hypothetical protein FOMMEDRAFT_139370 [Fomitiporia mediterranea MF3/22]